ATVRMRCLSPLRIADSGNPICPFQVFARLKNTVLSGMRYPLPLSTPGTTIGRNETAITFQMENPSKTENILKNTVSVIKEIPVIGNLFGIAGRIMGRGSLALAHMFNVNQEKIKLAEDRLKYIGMINKDRPIDISHPQPLLPMPVHCYSHGRGPYSSKKLRLQPEATTPHLEPHKTVNDTTNINELAQIPGLVGRFMVNTTNKQGDLLYELPACPFDPRYINLYPAVGSVNFQPPPVTYFSFMYNFYSGSLVYEFVPVKTSAHNFSIQVGFVPF
nr:VP3 [Opsiphanes invirae iflavirus 1]